MSSSQLDTLALVMAVAAACAIPGTLMVLRRLALAGDAIAHVLLFGIVLAYWVVGDLGSPWLFVGAAVSGVLAVGLVEALQRTGLVREDAALGLVFPALFSLGTLLASVLFRDTHLDVDSVLLGHAELAWQARPVVVQGAYLGRAPMLALLAVAGANGVLVIVFYKELKLTTFDPALAATFGFLPVVVHFGVMTSVSFSAVLAFDAVGPVLVLAFLVVPVCVTRLFTDRLAGLFLGAVGVGLVAAAAGVGVAYRVNTNMAGTVAAVLGVMFAVAFVAAPHRGVVAVAWRRRRARRQFLVTLLVGHLAHHESTPTAAAESSLAELPVHLGWTAEQVARVVRLAERAGAVEVAAGRLHLTPVGRARAAAALGV